MKCTAQIAAVLVAAGSSIALGQCVSGWQAVGDPAASALGGIVQAMTTWDPDGPGEQPAQIVATGSFATAGSDAIGRIGMWNGTQWLPFGAGISDGRGLVVRDNGDLVVVGTFASADGVPGTSRVASWTPGASTFAPLGTGVPGALLSVASYHGAGGTGAEQVVVGGQFSSGGLSRVASWDGAAW
ncbi:MAG TPA: hypothetical protein VEB22_06745, partial [Phycisphaerales bacterium]|nr:hypothetical protein [Phycisphaerales bacterium]